MSTPSTDGPAMAAGLASAERVQAQLRQRALRLLARRDFSRVELRQRLLAGRPGAPGSDGTDAGDAQAIRTEVDPVLDRLEGERLLSDLRFAEGVVRVQANRMGRARIVQALKAKGVDAAAMAEVVEPLRGSERDRALALWRRRFGGRPASDLRERARQHRFLMARGFDAGTVGWVLRQAPVGDPAEGPEDTVVDIDIDG